MAPTIFDPSPPTAPRPRVPRAIVRVRPAPPPASAPPASGRVATFWRALRATLEGIAHR
jgi:hypothetical protein